ncbi:MAG: outer membrane protein assembly factor BamE [Pseudomonadales bacterium]|nr:outer membrane protein assembly factor BamE [Pseudomonadales bacterium]
MNAYPIAYQWLFFPMSAFKLFIAASFTLIVSLQTACSTSHFPWVYRIDVEQGNIVDGDKLKQVTVGMNRRQVKYLLGTPMLQDTFNQDRWDYFYSFETGKGRLDRELLTLYFSGDQLSKIEKKDYDTTTRDF